MKPYYEESGIAIYHGDCRDVSIWAACDVMVTDPPYGIAWRRAHNSARNSKAHEGIANDHDTSTRDCAITMFGPKPAVVFGSFYAPYPNDVRQVLVRHKPADAGVVGSTTGYRRDCEPVFLVGNWPRRIVQSSSVIRSTKGSISGITTETGHPHTKPLDLISRLIAMTPGGSIADPFVGSGTTLVAAKNMGRRAIGIELDESYCEIAANRLRQSVLNFEVA